MEPLVLQISPYPALVGWSAVLLLIHVFLQSGLASKEVGADWNAGPRDEEKKPTGILPGRAARALENFKETYPAFIGLTLALAFTAQPSSWGVTGAWIWLIARIVYIPLYLAGIPYVRSIVWVISIVGLVIMLLTLLL